MTVRTVVAQSDPGRDSERSWWSLSATLRRRRESLIGTPTPRA